MPDQLSGGYPASASSPAVPLPAEPAGYEPVAPRGPAAYAAELIGTLMLVFFICTVLTVEQGGSTPYLDFAVIGLVHALVLSMLVYTLGGASGAHFNPAVTTTLAALRKIAPLDAFIYIVVQLSGGILGASLCKALLNGPGQDPVNYGAVGVSKLLHGSAGLALVAEIIGTFVLMWAIMGMAVNPRGERALAGLVIGSTLGFAVMAIGPMTGASFNPARALGPGLVANHFGPAGTWLLAYVVGPLIGAGLAGALYTLIVLGPQHREGRRPVDTLPRPTDSPAPLP